MKVTAAHLEKWSACKDQLAVFREEWGESVTLSRAVLMRAVGLGLDLGWWAERALIYAEYEKKLAPIDAEYYKAIAAVIADLLELPE